MNERICCECKGTDEVRERYDPFFGGTRLVCRVCFSWETYGRPPLEIKRNSKP